MTRCALEAGRRECVEPYGLPHMVHVHTRPIPNARARFETAEPACPPAVEGTPLRRSPFGRCASDGQRTSSSSASGYNPGFQQRATPRPRRYLVQSTHRRGGVQETRRRSSPDPKACPGSGFYRRVRQSTVGRCVGRRAVTARRRRRAGRDFRGRFRAPDMTKSDTGRCTGRRHRPHGRIG